MKLRGKRGQLAFLFVFFLLAIVIIIISAVMAPVAIEFNSKMYLAGESIIENAGTDIGNISNSAVRAELQSSLSNAQAATQYNIDINAGLFQYSWVLVVGLTLLVIFLATRRLVEVGGTGGFI